MSDTDGTEDGLRPLGQESASADAGGSARPKRRRRSREDVTERIKDAARQLFAERGYAGATTKEIARLADVSETLLFRYYGDKASLFNEVVSEPFQRLMDDFVSRNPDPTADGAREVAARRFTRQVFELFEGHEDMFRALLTGPAPQGADESGPGLQGLDPFFEQAADQVLSRYVKAGREPPFDLGVGVRLGLGMIASSVLLRDALFPAGPPHRDTVIAALEHMVDQAFGGPARD